MSGGTTGVWGGGVAASGCGGGVAASGSRRRWSGILWLLLGVSGLPRVPAFNHSPYGLTLLSSSLADLHSLTSWPTLPHAKHQPTSLSYRKATLASSPSRLTPGPPHLSGFPSGTSTLIRRKRAWSVLRALQSTSMTLPSACPISCTASSVIKSKGSPQTWTHIGMWVKVTEQAVMPFSHLRKTRIWLSKHQGPLFQTRGVVRNEHGGPGCNRNLLNIILKSIGYKIINFHISSYT